MHLKKIIPIIIAMFAMPFMMKAQVTTSSISGVVKSSTANPLPGATITAIHVPTGTKYVAIARSGGRFDVNNMNPGGPYKVTISFSGFDSDTKEDLFLILGETLRIDVDLKNKSTDLTTVVVGSTKRSAGAKIGTETSIGRTKLDVLPTVGRNLSDFIRFTPQAKVNGQSISIGGQNNRYNSFLIDGAVNNDVFGLSASGTNGGQAGTPPISIDAIDQIVVQISPYDAAQGNFTGGAINAITKSGSNNFHGSLYYIFRNQNLAGKAPTFGDVPQSQIVKYPNFQNKTYGFTLGGAIIKNKAFFFINAEQQRDNRPQPYTGPESITDSVNKLVNILKTNYNYDPGDWRNNEDKIDRTNVNTRFDFNIGSKNKLTASYRYTKAERINASRSTYNGAAGSINFVNGSQFFPSITNSGNIELNTKFTNNVNNKFRASFTNVNDDRGFVGNPFPSLFINSFNGGPSYSVGSEISSTGNVLKQNIVNFFDAFKINTGKHSITIGADIDLNKSYNLFINRNFGAYTYSALGPLPVPANNNTQQLSPLEAFRLGRTPSGYRRSYSLVDAPNKNGDESTNSAANFKSVRLGFFINDDIKITDDFTLTLGLRGDKTSFITEVPVDSFFNNIARPIIANSWDLKGAQSGKKFTPSWIFSPRLGFKYKIDDAGVTIRGGVGVFAGRTPLVWPGGIYANAGNLIGEINTSVGTAVSAITAFSNGGLFNSNYNGGVTTSTGIPLAFRPDINNQLTQTDFGLPANLLTPQGDLNLVASNFKLPAVLKASLAADKKLGNGWTLTTELNLTKNINEVDWQNVNIAPNSGVKTGGIDVREVNNLSNATGTGVPTRFIFRPTATTAAARNPYNNIILIKNTDGPKGYAYNFTVQLEKQYKNGFQFNAAYTYGNSQARNEATSSVNTSNWSFMETVNGRNNLVRSTSDFDLGHRLYALISKKFTYANKHAATTITFSYNGQSGNPYSYVYSGGLVGDGVTGNDLMYIPKDRAEMDLMSFVNTNAIVNGVSVVVSPTQQKDDLEAFINADKYLNKNRGKYAERNGARLPFTNILDFSLAQDFMINTGKTNHKLTIGLDIFNLTNLLNKNAGRQFFLSNDQSALVSFRGYTGGNIPTFSFNKPANDKPYVISDVQTSPSTSARWNGQATIRYSF
jgi:Carboxypeptidase regulatory-like domain